MTDPYTDMDEDMVLSDDSFDDPSYTPTKQTNYASDWSLASDEETESQVILTSYNFIIITSNSYSYMYYVL